MMINLFYKTMRILTWIIIIIAITVILGGILGVIAMDNKLEFKLPINGHNKILEVEDTLEFINNNLSDENGIYDI